LLFDYLLADAEAETSSFSIHLRVFVQFAEVNEEILLACSRYPTAVVNDANVDINKPFLAVICLLIEWFLQRE